MTKWLVEWGLFNNLYNQLTVKMKCCNSLESTATINLSSSIPGGIYDNIYFHVKLYLYGDTDHFDIVVGLQQEDTLAPYIFIICLRA